MHILCVVGWLYLLIYQHYEQIQKSIASTSSLKKSTEDLIRDDSAEADRIVKNIKDGKAKKSELDDKIKEMESNLAYMQKRYGIQINEKRYMVDYIFIADNLMPDITVLEREP